MSRGECFCPCHVASLAGAQVREKGSGEVTEKWCSRGAGRLGPETQPQFLASPQQCSPLDAAEDEPGGPDRGENLGEGPWRNPLAAACLWGLEGTGGGSCSAPGPSPY